MNDHRASAQPCASGESVHRDVGGWISGPSAHAEFVTAEHVRAGDVLLLDDRTRAEVTDIRHGDFWMNTGNHGPGVAIGWRAGTSSGVMFRNADDRLQRLLR